MSAFLQITLKVDTDNRPAAAAVYTKYKQPFLDSVPGAKSKEQLIRDEDVQVLHGFTSEDNARAYLTSDIFRNDVVGELGSLLEADPVISIYSVA